MRVQISYLAIILAIFATISHAFVGPTCMKIKDELGNRPDRSLGKFKELVCDKGCKPEFKHFTAWGRNNALQPIIKRVTKDMGIPDKEKMFNDLASKLFQIIKKDCVKSIPKGPAGNFCQDPDTFPKFATCLKGALLPAVMSHIGELMPLVSEPNCKKEFAYLMKDDLWDSLIPSYMAKYAEVCKKL
jgi:hypothetical protein